MMWLFTAVVLANGIRMLSAYQTGYLYIGWLPPWQFKFVTRATDPQLWRSNWIAFVGVTAAWVVALGYSISN
jgi:hypothetical protein